MFANQFVGITLIRILKTRRSSNEIDGFCRLVATDCSIGVSTVAAHSL